MKPILFNTENVRAILEDRKTVTRRLVKDARGNTPEHYGRKYFYKIDKNLNGRGMAYAGFYKGSDIFYMEGKKHIDAIYFKQKYQVGDILWVRETWQTVDNYDAEGLAYVYKASQNGKDWEENAEDWAWRPSIHMPKDAARIFLKVTDVRVEKLQDITEEQAIKEGSLPITTPNIQGKGRTHIQGFGELWNSTVKEDWQKFDANPWVWVYEFKQCEKPELVGVDK